MLWALVGVPLLLFVLGLVRRMLRPRMRLVGDVPIATKGAERDIATLTAYLPPTPIVGRTIEPRSFLFAMFQSLRVEVFCHANEVGADHFSWEGERVTVRVHTARDIDVVTNALAALARDLADPRWPDERLADLAESGPESVRVRAAMLLVNELPGSAVTRRACAALGWNEASARDAAHGGLSLPDLDAGALSLNDSSNRGDR